jgi:hypothetical protein
MFDERIAKRKYHAHKGVAKQRKVDFKLTYNEWIDIWLQSGQWDNRGARKGKYCMSRNNDVGPYEVGNVFIQLFEKNYSDAHKGNKKTEQHIANWRQSWYKNKMPT